MNPDTWVAIISGAVLALWLVAAVTDRRPKPTPQPNPAIEAAWDRSGKHPVWRGADYVRPSKRQGQTK